MIIMCLLIFIFTFAGALIGAYVALCKADRQEKKQIPVSSVQGFMNEYVYKRHLDDTVMKSEKKKERKKDLDVKFKNLENNKSNVQLQCEANNSNYQETLEQIRKDSNESFEYLAKK